MNILTTHHKKINILAWGFILFIALIAADLLKNQVVNPLNAIFPEGIYHYSGMLIISLVVVFILSILADVKYGVLCLFLFFPMLSRVSEHYQITIGHYNLTFESLLIYFLFCCNIIYRLKNKLFFLGKLKKAFTSLVLFLTVSYISALFNNPIISIDVILTAIIPSVLLYFIIVWNTARPDFLLNICKMLLFILVVSTIFTFYHPLFVNKVSVGIMFKNRWPSFFYNPIILAGVLVTLFPIYFQFLNVYKKSYQRRALFILIILSVGALMLTGSRGGVVVWFFQLVCLAFLTFKTNEQSFFRLEQIKRHKGSIITLILSLFGTILYFFKNPPEVLQRFTHFNLSDPGYSGYERIMAIRGAIEIGMNNFWGVGLGNFQEGYLKTETWRIGILKLESAHNLFLNIFAEGGVLALLFFTAFLLVIRSYLKRSALNKMNLKFKTNKYLALSFYSYLFYSIIFYGEFQHRNSSIPFYLFIVICALISSMYQYGSEQHE